jgi:hypothetical protein
MGHADIATTMIYVHHVPQIDAADKLSQLVTEAQNPVPGHVRDTVAERRETGNGEILQFPAPSEWARLDSNQGPTDYESVGHGSPTIHSGSLTIGRRRNPTALSTLVADREVAIARQYLQIAIFCPRSSVDRAAVSSF